MRVFMLGWEFPPHISGGLGTACYGLTKGLDAIGVDVCFVLPKAVPVDAESHVTVRSSSDLPTLPTESAPAVTQQAFDHVEIHQVDAVLQPYGTPESYEKALQQLKAMQAAEYLPQGSFDGGPGPYDGDLMGQVQRYARLAVELAAEEAFDVVHAHDWMTFPAAIAVAAAARKPLVVHVHSTEFDRAGERVNTQIYEIERTGMHSANAVICVSHLTQNTVAGRYGVGPEKLSVVYNAVETVSDEAEHMRPIERNEKIVLFLGRLTMQKGPEYFLRAAKKVVEKFDKVRFVVAGSGDMIAQCVRDVAQLGLGHHVTFTGFLHGPDVARVFQMADLYVMPSVSEPFGIAPLEALSHNVPVIISRQSGVSEVLTHVLKVDFWDTDEMANKILAVLTHPPLQRALRQHGHIELRKLSWEDSARQVRAVYEAVASSP